MSRYAGARAPMGLLAGALAAAMALAQGAPGGADSRRSGLALMSPSLRAMQEDDASNPAMLWIKEGESLWNLGAGRADRSCASCHGAAGGTMRDVATRYPAFDVLTSRPISLGDRVNACRVRHQRAEPLARDSESLLALEGFVAHQSRGRPVAPPRDSRLDPYRVRGAALWGQRMGQLGLSCAQCHDEQAGRRLAGSVIPQAHPTGYPIYRLEWQGLGALPRRIRACMTGVRAEPFADGATELVELELYLMQRARGMPLETPAVRP